MSSIPRVLILPIMILAGLLIVVGCDEDQGSDDIIGPKGPPGEQGEQGDTGLSGPDGDPRSTDINVFATLEIGPGEDDVWADFRASIYNASNIPNLTVNDRILEPDDYWFWSGGRLAYTSGVDAEDVDSFLIAVEYTRLDGSTGTGSASIRLAGPFVVLDDTIPVGFGEDVTMGWQSSEGADAYWFATYCTFSYKDTTGTNQFNTIRFDTLLTAGDTAVILPTSKMFPDSVEVQSVNYINGYGWVRAITGPWLANEASNFSGDATGTFVGCTITNASYLTYAVPGSAPDNAAESLEEIGQLFQRRVLELSQRQQKKQGQ